MYRDAGVSCLLSVCLFLFCPVHHTTWTVNRYVFVSSHVISSCTLFQKDLIQLELLCKQLYEATSSEDRMKAEAAVVLLSNSPDCLQKCQLLLERGDVSTDLYFCII